MLHRVLPGAYRSFREVLPVGALLNSFNSKEPLKQSVNIAGRIVSTRDLGKLLFLTLRSDGCALQVAVNVGPHFSAEVFHALKQKLRTGDIIGCTGTPGRTQKGEPTLFASDVRILSPYVCSDLVACPDQRGRVMLADAELRLRYRFVDMITNPGLLDTFKKRHAIIKALRRCGKQRKIHSL